MSKRSECEICGGTGVIHTLVNSECMFDPWDEPLLEEEDCEYCCPEEDSDD